MSLGFNLNETYIEISAGPKPYRLRGPSVDWDLHTSLPWYADFFKMFYFSVVFSLVVLYGIHGPGDVVSDRPLTRWSGILVMVTDTR